LDEQKTFATPLGINYQKVKVIVDDQKQAEQKLKAKANKDVKILG
jgi:hypothetical protein